MKHKLIKTDNYLLIVDDSEIEEGDLCYDSNASPGYKNNKFIVQCLRTDSKSYWNKHCKKIIAHLPLNNSPILEDVPLLPPLEIDNDKELHYQKQVMQPYPSDSHSYTGYEKGFVEGYNKAREKYKFTEEDIRRAWACAYMDALSIDEETYKPLFFEDFMQSLLQPKMPTHFELETECGFQNELGDFYYSLNSMVQIGKTTPICRIKTTTNSQGQVMACGKYIYE